MAITTTQRLFNCFDEFFGGKLDSDHLLKMTEINMNNVRHIADMKANTMRKPWVAPFTALVYTLQEIATDNGGGLSNIIHVSNEHVKRYLAKNGIDYVEFLEPLVQQVEQFRADNVEENLDADVPDKKILTEVEPEEDLTEYLGGDDEDFDVEQCPKCHSYSYTDGECYDCGYSKSNSHGGAFARDYAMAAGYGTDRFDEDIVEDADFIVTEGEELDDFVVGPQIDEFEPDPDFTEDDLIEDDTKPHVVVAEYADGKKIPYIYQGSLDGESAIGRAERHMKSSKQVVAYTIDGKRTEKA